MMLERVALRCGSGWLRRESVGHGRRDYRI